MPVWEIVWVRMSFTCELSCGGRLGLVWSGQAWPGLANTVASGEPSAWLAGGTGSPGPALSHLQSRGGY